ncbi:hypothetical protein ScPMuIL_000611 [Solemya velum]
MKVYFNLWSSSLNVLTQKKTDALCREFCTYQTDAIPPAYDPDDRIDVFWVAMEKMKTRHSVVNTAGRVIQTVVMATLLSGIDCQSTVYVRDGDDMRLNCTGGNGVQVKWYINDRTSSVLLTINAAINPNEPDFTVRLSVTYNEPPGQYTLVRTSFNDDTDSGCTAAKLVIHHIQPFQ